MTIPRVRRLTRPVRFGERFGERFGVGERLGPDHGRTLGEAERARAGDARGVDRRTGGDGILLKTNIFIERDYEAIADHYGTCAMPFSDCASCTSRQAVGVEVPSLGADDPC